VDEDPGRARAEGRSGGPLGPAGPRCPGERAAAAARVLRDGGDDRELPRGDLDFRELHRGRLPAGEADPLRAAAGPAGRCDRRPLLAPCRLGDRGRQRLLHRRYGRGGDHRQPDLLARRPRTGQPPRKGSRLVQQRR